VQQPVDVSVGERCQSHLHAHVPRHLGGPTRIEIDEPAQIRLALWATKTAFLFDTSGRQPVIPRGFLHALANQRQPSTTTVIWIGHCHHSQGVRGDRKIVSVRQDGSAESVAITFTIFNVLFQIFIHFNEDTMHLRDTRAATQIGQALAQIWPLRNMTVTWPPRFGVHSDEGWKLITDSIGEDRPFRR
jgi:hypothetical protein